MWNSRFSAHRIIIWLVSGSQQKVISTWIYYFQTCHARYARRDLLFFTMLNGILVFNFWWKPCKCWFCELLSCGNLCFLVLALNRMLFSFHKNNSWVQHSSFNVLIAIQTGTSTICLFNSWLEGNLQILLTVQAEELTQVLPCSLLGLLCASVMILDIKSLLMKI